MQNSGMHPAGTDGGSAAIVNYQTIVSLKTKEHSIPIKLFAQFRPASVKVALCLLMWLFASKSYHILNSLKAIGNLCTVQM